MAPQRVYIGPHLDDVVISCGGTLHARCCSSDHSEPPLVVTVFSRSNYTREGLGNEREVTPLRQQEERTVLAELGIEPVFLDLPECPLRGYTIQDPLDYPKTLKPELDAKTVEQVAERLAPLLRNCAAVYLPLGLGTAAHVDHRLCRAAALRAQQRFPRIAVWFYEDVPYIVGPVREALKRLPNVEQQQTGIDLDAKLELIRGYRSQPIDAWENMIREQAGQPPVERTWRVQDSRVLTSLADPAASP